MNDHIYIPLFSTNACVCVDVLKLGHTKIKRGNVVDSRNIKI